MTEAEKKRLVTYRLDTARKTLLEAELLINNKMWNAAVNRLYYACFYAVNALLVNNDIKAKKHSGVIQMFGLYFINTNIISNEAGKLYSLLFDMRQSGDYTDYFDFEEQEVIVLMEPAKQFISQIEEIIN